MLLKVRGLIVELEILVLRGGVKVKCPFCENIDTKVIDSRPTEEGHAIRRRRECDNCRKRFTTYEKVEEIPMMVVKKDGSREVFDRNKVLNGIIKACEKRPVSMNEIEKIVDEIERGLSNMMEKEIESRVIGEVIMDQLKGIDEVAYVRFASVYRQFKDINTFISELEKLLNDSKK
jgi:transcriptional repressor NrdR